jgi:HK97 family phage portal protein
VINWLKRAILSTSGPINRWSRPWAGYGLPMRTVWGPPLMGGRVYGGGEAPESLPTVYGAASLLADACCSVEWTVVRRSSTQAGTATVENIAAAHALASWPLHERWAWCWGALIGGNGVAQLHRDGRGAPERLEVFPPERITFRWYDGGRLTYLLLPIAAGEVIEAEAEDVAHLRYRPTHWDSRIGIPPTASAAASIEMLLQTRRMATATAANAARPSLYMTAPGRLDARKAEQIRERWEQLHGGHSVGGTAVLEEGLSIQQMPMADLVATCFEATSKLGAADIARLFSIPPDLLLGSENRATATEARRRLIAFGVSPVARMAEDALASALLSPEQRRSGYHIRVDTSTEELGAGVEFSTAISGLLNAGALSPNEIRTRLGYARVEGGDELRAPVNTYPLSNWQHFAPAALIEPPPDPVKTSGQAALKAISHRWVNGHGG